MCLERRSTMSSSCLQFETILVASLSITDRDHSVPFKVRKSPLAEAYPYIKAFIPLKGSGLE